ncbi:MAG TPA: hypothetical protein DD738_08370 [Ruminiclostridium sp.]|jgi:uncharacterized protein YrrD|nr:hypothetical protein [Ruminiclostridium sp.]
MKTAQQIIGLPVVSIFDGNEIGKVKNVIINASKGTIDFFVIDSGIRSLAGGVIPADRVLGIGEYALTIQQPDDISDIVKIPAAIELMQKNITVRGTRVLTRKGSLLGETGDIYINDEDSYNITGVEFIPAGNEAPSGIIPRGSIITFGKNLLVVHDDFISRLIEASSGIETVLNEEKKNINLNFQNKDPEHELALENADEPADKFKAESDELFKIDSFVPAQSTEEDLRILAADDTGGKIEEADAQAPLSSADLFEQRQRQYLVGKKVTKTIVDASGGILVNSGEIITDEIVQAVKENGKLIELVMNYGE